MENGGEGVEVVENEDRSALIQAYWYDDTNTRYAVSMQTHPGLRSMLALQRSISVSSFLVHCDCSQLCLHPRSH